MSHIDLSNDSGFTCRAIAVADASADPLRDWILTSGLGGVGMTALVEGLCNRLVEAAVPLLRVTIGHDTLHPQMEGTGVAWHRQRPEIEPRDYLFDEEGGTERQEEWERSPFYALFERGGGVLRADPRRPAAQRRFPYLAEIHGDGCTDYLCFVVPIMERPDPKDGHFLYVSLSTDAVGGFTDRHVARIEGLMPLLALAVRSLAMEQRGQILMETYLGTDAANRVLAGAIRRGGAARIRAVIWFSDLVGFTRVADKTHDDDLLGLLDAYFDCCVKAVHGHGGEVLKFVGDGVLAIFRMEGDETDPCIQALDAADTFFASVDRINPDRQAANRPPIRACLGLHVGDVLYGNVGARSRLDFTVVGTAVNEASRIEGLCRQYERDVLVSSAFAKACGAARDRLIPVGRYALKGLERPEELLTLTSRLGS
ncbi:MAG: adenylate/guanylate cyclase domain-containing protein [Inquilinaceae bacterium]